VNFLIRIVYHKVHMKAPSLSLKIKLAWSVLALNNTPPRDGTAASVLVFGNLPRLPVSGLDQNCTLTERLSINCLAYYARRGGTPERSPKTFENQAQRIQRLE
jgi:hypothetical protein